MRVRYKDRWYEAIQASYDYTTSRWWYNIIDQPDTDPLHTEWVTNAAEEQPKMPTYWAENKDINQNKKKMTQKEFDLRMQELRLQYLKELNEIKRQMDEVSRKKTFQLNADEKDFYTYKDEMMCKIDKYKQERAYLDPDDQDREIRTAAICSCQSEIDKRAHKMKIDQNAVIEETANELQKLNQKARKLKEWYEEERLKAMQELAASQGKAKEAEDGSC